MNVISHMQSEFRRKWLFVGVLWLAVYKSVTKKKINTSSSTHIPIHHDVISVF